jgi:hypothetical protein
LVSVVSAVVMAQPVAAGVLQSVPAAAAAAVRAPTAVMRSAANDSHDMARMRRTGIDGMRGSFKMGPDGPSESERYRAHEAQSQCYF